MPTLEDISASVEVQAWINGHHVDLEDVAVATQRLIYAAEPFLPRHWLEDTEDQRTLRSAVKHLIDLKCFK